MHVVCNLEARRTPGEGDDRIAMGGAADEAGVLSNLSWKNRRNHQCSFACAQLVGTASAGRMSAKRFVGNKPSPYKIGGVGGRLTAEAEKTSSCVCGLHDDARPGEPDKKSGDVAAPPGGGGRQIY